MSSLDLNNAFRKASVGFRPQHFEEDQEEMEEEEGGEGLEGFRLMLSLDLLPSSNEINNNNNEEEVEELNRNEESSKELSNDFTRKLLGPAISLLYSPPQFNTTTRREDAGKGRASGAMELILTKKVLGEYERIWSFMICLKGLERSLGRM